MKFDGSWILVHITVIPLRFGNSVAQELGRTGIDYLSLSLWNAFKQPDKDSSGTKTIVRRFRDALPASIAVTVSGKVWTTEESLRALDIGADFVALGGAAIANPDWPRQSLSNDFAPTRFPLTPSELNLRGVSEPFVEYLKRWSFVQEENN